MTREEKNRIIARYLDSIEPLLTKVSALKGDALDFRPDIEDAWTIREHLAHFLHADMFAYTRVGLSICEPGATVYAWKEGQWTSRVKSTFMDAKDIIASIRSVRKSIAALAESLDESLWDAAVVEHPVRGTLKMADILGIYSEHAVSHMKYVERNLGAMKL